MWVLATGYPLAEIKITGLYNLVIGRLFSQIFPFQNWGNRAEKEMHFILFRELLSRRAERKLALCPFCHCTVNIGQNYFSRINETQYEKSWTGLSPPQTRLKREVSSPAAHGSPCNSKDNTMIAIVKFSFEDFSFVLTGRFLIITEYKLNFFMEPMRILNKRAGIVC